MAIKSTVSYVISEEQDGFVAVDFDLINGHDDEIRDWEIVDDCSSIGENSDEDVDFTRSVQSDECSSDEIAVEDLDSMPNYSPEMFGSRHRSTAADGDVIEYVQGEEDEGAGDSSDNLCENGEDLHELFAGEDSKSVLENIVDDREIDTVESMPPIITRNRQVYHELLSYRTYRDYDYDYSYDRREEEEVDYDLDDELVPYSAKMKLGRERMRKLGKRSCSKLVKSKRLTYNDNKAGCVRGKHGLGLKHSLI